MNPNYSPCAIVEYVSSDWNAIMDRLEETLLLDPKWGIEEHTHRVGSIQDPDLIIQRITEDSFTFLGVFPRTSSENHWKSN
jgi:hypothetical protein